MQIRVNRGRQGAADAGRILGNGRCGRSHGGHVVAAVDMHGHGSGGRAAVIFRDRHRERVGQAFARAQALHRGQGGIQHITVVAVGVHAERAVGAGCIGLGREADHIMHIHIRGLGQRAAGNSRSFGNIYGCGGQYRQIVGAVDGHCQGIGGCGPVIVGHRKGEGLCQALTHAQALHHGQRIIQDIDIVAVGVHAERAVETGGISLWAEGHNIMDISIHGRGQRAADHRRVFCDGSRGSCHRGRVIAPVDAHGDHRGR